MLPIMILILTHYSIIIMLYKKSNELHHRLYSTKFMLSKFTVLVHRPFSTTVQQITRDVTLFLLSESLILLHYSH